jgi:hypothetical protein
VGQASTWTETNQPQQPTGHATDGSSSIGASSRVSRPLSVVGLSAIEHGDRRQQGHVRPWHRRPPGRGGVFVLLGNGNGTFGTGRFHPARLTQTTHMTTITYADGVSVGEEDLSLTLL